MAEYRKIGVEIIFSYALLGAQILLAPLLIFLLTRFLTTEEFGAYSLFTVIIMILSLVLDLGASQFLMAKIPGQREEKRAGIFYSVLRFEIIFLALAGVALIFSPLKTWFLEFSKLTRYPLEFDIVILTALITTIAVLFFYYVRAKQLVNTANIIDFLRNRIPVFLLAALFLMFGNFELFHVVLFMLLGTFACVVTYLVLERKEVFIYISRKSAGMPVTEMLKFGLPLMPVMINSWLVTGTSRYILNEHLSLESVAFYTLAYSLLGIVMTFGASASQVIQPYFAKAWNLKEDYNTFMNMSIKYGIMLIFPAMVGVVAMRREIVTLLSGSKYLASVDLVPVMLLYPLFAFLSYVFYQALVSANKTKITGIIYAINIFANIGLTIVLVKFYSLLGAAIATVASYFLLFLMTYLASRDVFEFRFNFLKIPHIAAASIIMGAILSFIHPPTAMTKLLAIGGGGLLYVGLLFVFKVFTENEKKTIKELLALKWLPLPGWMQS